MRRSTPLPLRSARPLTRHFPHPTNPLGTLPREPPLQPAAARPSAAQAQHPDLIFPKIPRRGGFDLKNVRRSTYFFS